MMTLNLGQFALFLGAFLILNYLIFAVGGYLFFYKLLGPHISHREILEKKPTKAQMKEEIVNSLYTQVIFYLMGLGLYGVYQKGYTFIYSDYDKFGPFYFWINFFLIQQFHDAYFYWTHRWMHEWKWLKKYHFIHHASHPPTPFSSLSFHPVEAISHGLFWWLIAFILPSHVIWMFMFYSFMFYINMWGHTGFEFWHKDLLTHPLLKILNTPTHHNLHHKYHQANYSIYYNFWDKLCGTNHPEYENHYRAVKAKTERAKTSKLMKAMKL